MNKLMTKMISFSLTIVFIFSFLGTGYASAAAKMSFLSGSDIIAPTATINSPVDDAAVNGTVAITGTVTDDTNGSGISSWNLYYALGYETKNGTLIASGTSAVSTVSTLGNLDTSTMVSGATYTVWLTASDVAGNRNTDSVEILKDAVSPAAVLNDPTTHGYVNNTVTVDGSASDENLSSWILDYGVGSSPTTYTTINSGTDSIHDDTLGSWNTSSLSNGTYTLRLRATDTAGNLTTKSIQVIKDSTGPSAPTGLFTDPVATTTWAKNASPNIDWTGGMNTSGSDLDYQEYQLDSGSWAAMPYDQVIRLSTSGAHTINVRGVDEVGNRGSSAAITYKLDTVGPVAPTISTNPDASTSQTSTSSPVLSWSNLTDATSGLKKLQYKINRGSWTNITSTSSSGTVNIPALSSTDIYTIYLRGVDNAGNNGTASSVLYLYKTVMPKAPSGLYTISNANHAILLRWTAPSTDSVTYTVYRSTSQNGTYTAVASGITNTYWYDYTLQYGQTFYYKVTANITIAGSQKESTATSVASGTVIASADIDAGIGSKPSWTFISSSAGKINAISGNLYYQSSDFSQYSPGNDMSMVRTYNSLATSKTTLGAGWDFNYNICLLREYNTSGQETAMILKDGDGTMYRFTKNGSTYTRPAGVYMNLTVASGVYQATAKNGTVYLFDSQLRVSSITDRNNNTLTFAYDASRGNLTSVTDRLGHQISFTYTSNGSNVDLLATATDCYGNEQDYTYDTTTHKVQESYIWLNTQQTDKYGEVYSYDSNSRLSQVANPAGNSSTIGYNPSGYVSSVNDPLYDSTHTYEALSVSYLTGSTTSTFRNATQTYAFTNGLLTTETDPLGHSTTYGYDADFNVTSVAYTNRADYTDNVTIENDFVYDSNGNLTKSTDPYGYSTYYLNYNSFGEAGSVIKPFTHNTGEPIYYVKQDSTYDSRGNQLTVGQVTKGTYIESTQTFTASGNPMGPQSAYTYDDTFVNKLTDSSTVNGVTSQTQYEYDDLGRLSETIDPDGSTTTQGYDYDKGYINWTDDANELRTTYTYDVLGRKIGDVLPGTDNSITSDDTTETYTYDKNNNLIDSLSSTIENGATVNDETKSYFDVLGRSTSTTTAYGTADASTTSTNYGAPDTNGNYTITSTSGEGVSTHTTYNANGLATLVSDDSNNTVSQSWYDSCGNVNKTQDSTGKINITEYDKLGRAIKTINDQGNAPHKNITCTTGYDLQGNVITSTDEKGIVTETTYDILARQLTVKTTDSSTNPPNVSQSSYSYDNTNGTNGLIENSVTDGLGHVIDSFYDKSGNMVKKEDEGTPGSGDEMITLYDYDEDGNMISQTAPDDSVITNSYDGNNQLNETDYTDDFYVNYEYDNSGNQISMIQTKGGTVTTKDLEYDSQNRIVTVKQNGTVIVRYEYNDDNSVSKMKYPQSSGTDKVISYTYDSNGRLYEISDATDPQNVQLIRKYNYNATTGMLDTLDDYRKFDQGASNDGDYTEQSFVYDTLGRLQNVSYTDVDMDGNGTELSRTTREGYALAYDDASNITSENISTNYGTSSSVLKEYVYDGFNRLTTEKVNGTTTAAYTFDNDGNRKSLTASSGTLYYNYNEFNELTQTASDQSFANIVSSFTYDGRGNQSAETDNNGSTSTVITNFFNAADELDKVKKKVGSGSNTTIATYSYDGSGQRTKKVEGSTTTRYYYGGLNLLYTDDGTSQRVEENILEPDGSVLASKRFTGNYAGKNYFYRQDVHGSITNVVDKDGNDVVGQTYDAYGNTTKTGDAGLPLSFAYAGAVIDHATGLYYMNARYYSPALGAFITRDTEDGQAAYNYCEGDPVNNTDRTGHLTEANILSFINKAYSQLGLKDSIEDTKIDAQGNKIYNQDGTNHVKYNKWYYQWDHDNTSPTPKTDGSHYGNNTPWCAAFVSWCAEEQGDTTRKALINGRPYALCRYLETDFSNAGKLHVTADYSGHAGQLDNYTPRLGDVIFFMTDESSDGSTHHTGIVVGFDSIADIVFTIEGNYANAVNLEMHPLYDYEHLWGTKLERTIRSFGNTSASVNWPDYSYWLNYYTNTLDYKKYQCGTNYGYNPPKSPYQ